MKTQFLIVFCGFLLISSMAIAQVNFWRSPGSRIGESCNAIAFEPGGAILAGGDSGIYNSTDSGITWTMLAGVNSSPSITWVNSIVTYSGGRILAFAGQGGNGAFLSTDYGSTWSKLAASSDTIFATAKSTSDGYLYGIGSTYSFSGISHVYYSTDRGSTWISAPNSAYSLRSICVDSSGALYAGSANGWVLKSTDHGTTWTPVGDQIPGQPDLSNMTTGPSGHVYAASRAGVYSFNDNTWSEISSGIDSTITLMTSNSIGELFVGTTTGRFYGTTNNGMTWTALIGGLPANPGMCSALAMDSRGYLYAGTSPNDTLSDFFASGTSTVPSVPASPALISPANESESVPETASLSWSTTSGAEHYEVQAATDSNFANVIFDDSTITSVSKQLVLKSAVRYYWRVRSINIAGKSPFSKSWTFVTLVTPPSALTAITSNGNVTLSWEPSDAAHLMDYRIYRGTSADNLLIFDSCAVTTYIDSALTSGTTYYYEVAAVDSLYGESVFSNEANSTGTNNALGNMTWIALKNPNANAWWEVLSPLGTGIVVGGDSGAYVTSNEGDTWTLVTENYWSITGLGCYGDSAIAYAGGYGLYRSSDGGGEWNLVRSGYLMAPVSDIEIRQNDAFVAMEDSGLIVSNDGGLQWGSKKSIPNAFLGAVLAIDSSGNLFLGNESGTYRSTNQGDSWSLVANDTTNAIFVTSNGSILIGGPVLRRSTDDGTSWNIVQGGPGNIFSFCSNKYGFIYASGIPGRTGSNGDIYRSTDDGKTWSEVASGIQGPLAIDSLGYLFALNGGKFYRSSLTTTPAGYDRPPIAASLADVNVMNSGRTLTSAVTFSSAGSSDPDGTVDSTIWYVNNRRVSSSSSLTYDFGSGTSRVKLVVVDNKGVSDSSVAFVNKAAFVKTLGGEITSGLSMVGDNVLYAIASGDAVYRLDSNGTVVYKLQVAGSGGSSCSIAYDSSAYISSSDNDLYAFSKNATSVWPALPLGGNASATPTVDSSLQRIYIGISNDNFLAVDRLTGKIVWNFFTGSPITNSAVISGDRKLFFPTSNGTLYGVDLKASDKPAAPTWYLVLPDTMPTSPAIDDSGNFYVGTSAGNLYSVSMQRQEQASQLWVLHLGGQIVAPPVIGANKILYVGSTDSTFYAVNLTSQSIAWKYRTNGPIRFAAAISDAGNIYFDNGSGSLYCLDDSGKVKWSFSGSADSLGVKGPILYSRGTAYAGAGSNSVIAFYDGNTIHSGAYRVSSVNLPAWGTFQGNNQRTGVQNVQGSGSGGSAVTPTSYALYPNYPNPFNPTTTITYDIPKQSNVEITLYDVLGQRIRTILDAPKGPGEYTAHLNAEGLASGVYFYRLKAGNYVAVRKMMVLK